VVVVNAENDGLAPCCEPINGQRELTQGRRLSRSRVVPGGDDQCAILPPCNQR
jgi:hypothetical protein